MPAGPSDLFAYLQRLGIATTTVQHPPLFTVEQSRGLRGEIPGAHTKNLFLVDRKERYFLVSAEEDADIDLKGLHRLIGASGRLSFGKPEALRDRLGVEPGAVTVFAAINDREQKVGIVLDQQMLTQETVNFHPLVNTMTTRIATADLLRFLQATGHKPQIVRLSVKPGEAPAGTSR